MFCENAQVAALAPRGEIIVSGAAGNNISRGDGILLQVRAGVSVDVASGGPGPAGHIGLLHRAVAAGTRFRAPVRDQFRSENGGLRTGSVCRGKYSGGGEHGGPKASHGSPSFQYFRSLPGQYTVERLRDLILPAPRR